MRADEPGCYHAPRTELGEGSGEIDGVKLPWGRVFRYAFVLFLATLAAGVVGAEAEGALGLPDAGWPRASSIGTVTAAVFGVLAYRTGEGTPGLVLPVSLVVALVAWLVPYRFNVWFFMGSPGEPWASVTFLLVTGMALGLGIGMCLRATRRPRRRPPS